IGAKNGLLPTIYYQEYHTYVARDDQMTFTVRHNPDCKVPAIHPRTQRPMTIDERDEIRLYVTDENYTDVKKALYTEYNEVLTDADGDYIQQVNVGDTVFALTRPRRMIIVKNPEDFTRKHLSVYDALKHRLVEVKKRFRDAADRNELIIASEKGVMFDKLVQIMDVAREAEFANISIAQLRS
ncbi:MAG: ExbD/TolR family protein, partial [Chitinivibrionales bacterium]